MPVSGLRSAMRTTTVTCSATDPSRHSFPTRRSSDLTDTVPPTITCSSNRVVNVLAGTCSSNVTFVVTATDNCAVTDIASVPARVTEFAGVTTTVSNTATDGSGNSATCSFKVTVNDVQ